MLSLLFSSKYFPVPMAMMSLICELCFFFLLILKWLYVTLLWLTLAQFNCAENTLCKISILEYQWRIALWLTIWLMLVMLRVHLKIMCILSLEVIVKFVNDVVYMLCSSFAFFLIVLSFTKAYFKNLYYCAFVYFSL